MAQVIADAGGWIGFDRFMELALYEPDLGYYTGDGTKFGIMPGVQAVRGSDFVTAPEITPYFGAALATQVAQALEVTGTREVWEFGAGTGALAAQLLQALGERVDGYTIVDLSGSLQQRQRELLKPHGSRVRWADSLPAGFRAVVVGNEVLDAMPVQLLARRGGVWHERGVAVGSGAQFVWQDHPTALRPPIEVAAEHDYLTEIHPQAQAFVSTLADRLLQGAAFFLDYGFPEREYYHAQRAMGTVMCHRAHHMDTDPLADVGQKDITAHVNFTALALAAQHPPMPVAPGGGGGFGVLGYTSQARFLINCGLLSLMENASMQQRVMAQKLLMEHEMGELFKVIGFCKGAPWEAIGFSQGDRTHRL